MILYTLIGEFKIERKRKRGKNGGIKTALHNNIVTDRLVNVLIIEMKKKKIF